MAITNLSDGLLYDNTDDNIIIGNVNETMNLSTRLNVSYINVENEIKTSSIVTSSLPFPDSSLTMAKISNLNTCLSTINSHNSDIDRELIDLGNIETKARNWAESDTEPDGVGTKSSKTWAGESELARDESQKWAESTTEPDGTGTKSSKTWAVESGNARDDSRKWAQSTTEPDGGGTKSSKLGRE